ncbi:hypothetical protein Sjap_011518 [Stephania japonica]|uniref:Uncharacterized protein n=1 Tax=Stephania japonica TaxID=461633 RepID=A0AAP0JBJ0_9MAGN
MTKVHEVFPPNITELAAMVSWNVRNNRSVMFGTRETKRSHKLWRELEHIWWRGGSTVGGCYWEGTKMVLGGPTILRNGKWQLSRNGTFTCNVDATVFKDDSGQLATTTTKTKVGDEDEVNNDEDEDEVDEFKGTVEEEEKMETTTTMKKLKESKE